MNKSPVDLRLIARLIWLSRASAAAALLISALAWAGWATGVEELTRVYRTWPQMVPWTALWVSALRVAILVQAGQPSHGRVWVGRGVAVVVGACAVVVLAEYASARSFGLDTMWFSEAVRTLQSSWPGRPSPFTASSVLLLAAAIALARVERPSTRVVWPVFIVGGAVIPCVCVVAYLGAMPLVALTPSTAMAISTALALLLLVVATALARPDRPPLAWLLVRSDWGALLRLYGLGVGLLVFIALLRLTFLSLGLSQNAAFVLSVVVCIVGAGVVGFRLRHQEQSLLKDRAEAEMKYHILADNAVDIVVHLRDGRVVWISPSVEAPFGVPPEQWIGSDYLSHVHPDDVDNVRNAFREIGSAKNAAARYRLRTAAGKYHWVDGHGKPYIDAAGNTDGATGSMRVVDDQVEAEQQLERLARFDVLTGLVNRAEAIARFESALKNPRSPGAYLGVLFCDIDHFKDVNDTSGHAVGDIVLATLADRIRECIRDGDTVGRVGGDEMLVLLPGLHNLDEVANIAEKIRCRAAEPIGHAGTTINTTLSIGATIAAPGESAAAVTARADAAMYQAKHAGRNRVTRIDTGNQAVTT